MATLADLLAGLTPEERARLAQEGFDVPNESAIPYPDSILDSQFNADPNDPMFSPDQTLRVSYTPPAGAGIGGQSRQAFGQPQQQAFQEPQAPQNYFQRTTEGNVGPKVSMDAAVTQGQQNVANYANPVEIVGYGKGFPLKGSPGSYAMQDGRIVRLTQPVDPKIAAQREELAIKRALTEAQIRALDRKGQPSASGMPQGLKLKQGEMWDAVTQKVVPAPGSDLERKVAGEVTEAKTGFRELDKQFDRLEQVVNDIQGSPINAAVGWFDSIVPNWASMTPNDKADVRSKIINLQELLQTKGLQDLRASGVAPGSVTEKEWGKFAAMVGNIDPTQSEDKFKQELVRVKQQIETERANQRTRMVEAQERYGPLWDKVSAPTQPQQPTGKEVSWQEVMETAKKYGKDPLQVRRDAEAKGYKIRGM